MSKENEQKPFNGLTEALTFQDVINYEHHSTGEYADVFDERMYELFKALSFNRDINAYLDLDPALSVQVLTKVWKNHEGTHWIEINVYSIAESNGYSFDFKLKATKKMANGTVLIMEAFKLTCSTPAELFRINVMEDLLIASRIK